MNRILRINVVWLFIMSPLNAAVTAGYSGPTFNGSAGVGFNGRGQTFTASIGGTLTSISLILKGSDAGDATVGVHTVAAGLPSTLLGEVVIPATTIPPVVSPAFVTADFSGLGIELAVGTQYAISLRQSSAGANPNWLYAPGVPYAGGHSIQQINPTTWQIDSLGTFGFSVMVDPVPEPSAALLGGLGALLLLRRRRG
jgi:MYXO-CTERM domain-containing protein